MAAEPTAMVLVYGAVLVVENYYEGFRALRDNNMFLLLFLLLLVIGIGITLFRGRTIEKVVPWPSWLSTVSVPPWPCTMMS